MLDDIRSVSEISNLSIRQLKELLVTNYVDYKGCCEKQELLDRVQRLWMAHSKNREIGIHHSIFYDLTGHCHLLLLSNVMALLPQSS